MYWQSKRYKNPTKAKTIIAAQKCILKLLFKSITFVFKLIFNQMYSYHKQGSFF